MRRSTSTERLCFIDNPLNLYFCEPLFVQNSVVWVEDSQDGSALTAKEKGTAQKRSLNDVLGKKAPASKGANNPAGTLSLLTEVVT